MKVTSMHKTGGENSSDFSALFIYQTRIQRGSDARGEIGDNEVMIYDLVGDYNSNWPEDVSPRREREVITT